MTGIERVKVLQGHTDEGTAYQVDDYPYSFRLRCKIRYWIETATKGAKRGQRRFVSQTTDARADNIWWNKPKASNYVLMAVMYVDSAGQVDWSGISEYGLTPQADASWRLRGIYEQLTDAQRHEYDKWMTVSRRDVEGWARWERIVADIAAHLQKTGDEPTTVNGTWTGSDGRLVYLGNENVPLYVATARQRLTNP
jgi:hypothetical protein